MSSGVVVSAETGPDGCAQFKGLEAGHYDLVATKDGFESVRKSGLDLTAAGSISVDLMLVSAPARRESVEVNGSAAPLEQGDSSADSLPPQSARELPGRSATLADALPLVPVHANIADPAYGYFFGQRGRHFTADFDVIF
jgi:hypothetical protein